MLKINDFFDSLVQYDWTTFNNIDDAFLQLSEYTHILNKFRELALTELKNNNIQFNELYNLIDLRNTQIRALPFMGKLYIKVNPFLMAGQLKNIVKEIEFDTEKSNRLFSTCECKERHQYKLAPNVKYLTEIGFGCNGYYNYKIHECAECGFRWSSYTQDDAAGKTIYEKWNEKDFPNNKKQSQ